MTFTTDTSRQRRSALKRRQSLNVKAAKAECARRITAVADIVTQTNLLAASQTGQLSEAEQATFLAGHQWIRAMQAAWPLSGREWG